MEDIEPGEYVLFLVLYIENESQSPCELPATYEPIFYELNGRNVMAVIEQRGDIWALETSVEEPRGTWGDKYLLAMVMLDYSVSAGDVRSFDFDLYCGH